MSKKMEKKRSCLEYNPNQTFQNKFPFYLHANIDTLKLNWLLREAACSQTSNTISLRHSMVDNWNSHVHWLIVLSIYKGHTLFVCMIICLTTQSSCYSLLTSSWTTIWMEILQRSVLQVSMYQSPIEFTVPRCVHMITLRMHRLTKLLYWCLTFQLMYNSFYIPQHA